MMISLNDVQQTVKINHKLNLPAECLKWDRLREFSNTNHIWG